MPLFISISRARRPTTVQKWRNINNNMRISRALFQPEVKSETNKYYTPSQLPITAPHYTKCNEIVNDAVFYTHGTF